ncbi:MAG: hypothetical protein LBE31_10515 [Deltaproteobacteria bacterium]|jgi:hypothetical protein|nr:hypothetical protein [Deltaproteobacteria bacterium]
MTKSESSKNDVNNHQTSEFFEENGQYDELNDFLREFTNLLVQHKGDFPKTLLLDATRVLLNHRAEFDLECSDQNNPMTIVKLEDMIIQMNKAFEEINLKVFADDVQRLEDEGLIIAQKKNEFRKKGIRLRVYQRYPTTVMTAVGQMKYQRMALRPSFEKDKNLLAENGVHGYIYPLDDALGLTQLPFKMTIESMLIVAKEASRRESYEDSEQSLKELTLITTNDDTIRSVTNTIGGLVHANDMRIASEVWDKFISGHLVFPETKIDHTLYLQCDGAMLATRPEKSNVTDEPSPAPEPEHEDKKKKVIWKENKLGMAFSSDNIRYWTDKHGKRQHCINKREYTSFIGTCDEFSKLMFSMSIRNGYGSYKNTVLISDGATWIRNMKEIYFHDAVQILDFYHLCEHIYTFSKELHDFDESKYVKWAETLVNLFRFSKSKEAIEIIRKLPKRQIAKANFDFLQYIDNNKNNIDYLSYRKQGFFIGSGAIESGNKIVLQRRMKQGGMRWNIENAQAVVSLNAKRRSNLWETDVVDLAYIHYAGAPSHIVKQRNLHSLGQNVQQIV